MWVFRGLQKFKITYSKADSLWRNNAKGRGRVLGLEHRSSSRASSCGSPGVGTSTPSINIRMKPGIAGTQG